MGQLIQFPHYPGKKWSPSEILAIPEPVGTRERVRQERSRIAITKMIAAEAPKREKKKATRKQQILAILDTDEEQTIASLMRLIGDRIGRQTVADCLTELETEGLVCRTGRLWISTRDLEE